MKKKQSTEQILASLRERARAVAENKLERQPATLIPAADFDAGFLARMRKHGQTDYDQAIASGDCIELSGLSDAELRKALWGDDQ